MMNGESTEDIDDKLLKVFDIDVRDGEFDADNPERLSPETLFMLHDVLNRGGFFVRMCRDLNYWRTAKRYAPRLIELAVILRRVAEEGEKCHDSREKQKRTGRLIKVPR